MLYVEANHIEKEEPEISKMVESVDNFLLISNRSDRLYTNLHPTDFTALIQIHNSFMAPGNTISLTRQTD